MTKLYFKTVSPLHIGTGKVLEPFDYIFHQEKVLILDHEACLNRVFESHPEAVDRYVTWIQEVTDRINNTRKEAQHARQKRDRKKAKQENQILSDLRRNFNLIYFCDSVLRDKELAQALLTQPEFHRRAMYAMDRPSGTRQLREIIHINGTPYVPGSSLKGAIRTALAYRVVKSLSGDSLQSLLDGKSGTNIRGIREPLRKIRELSEKAISAIEEGNERKINQSLRDLSQERKFWITKQRIGDEVEKVIFGCGGGKEKGQEKFDDPKFDLLRLLKISDSIDTEYDLVAGHLISFTRNNRTGQLSSQPIQYCQFIDEGGVFSVSMEIDTGLVGAILNNWVKGWSGFADKFKRLFDVEPGLSHSELEQAVAASVLDAIRDFGHAILDKEKEWLDQFAANEMSQLHEFYDHLSREHPLLRAGFSSGWHGATIGLALAENPALSEYLPEIIYVFNLDLIQKQEKLLRPAERKQFRIDQQLRLLRRTPRPPAFPRSRRLIAEGRRRPYAPVGWLQVSLQPLRVSGRPRQKEKARSSEPAASPQETPSVSFDQKVQKLKEKFGK